MNGYSLQPNEILLFEGRASYRFDDNYSDPDFAGQNAVCTVLLTNLSVVLQARIRRFFRNYLARTIEIPVDEMKMHQGMPAVQTDSSGKVRLSFIRNDLVLHFDSLISAKKFQTEFINLMTGTTPVSRGLLKAAQFAGQGAAQLIGELSKSFAKGFSQSRPRQTSSNSGRQDALDKLFDLYKDGILTREEYHKKRSEVLNR